MFGIPNRTERTYRSKDGRHFFGFRFVKSGEAYEVICTRHPSLGGRDSSAHKTHLFSSGRLCFVGGREPRSLRRAEQLAAQWAEYYLEYRRTGITQG